MLALGSGLGLQMWFKTRKYTLNDANIIEHDWLMNGNLPVGHQTSQFFSSATSSLPLITSAIALSTLVLFVWVHEFRAIVASGTALGKF